MPYSQDFINALNHAAIITETDLQGRIISVNELFCKISGYSAAELLGSPHRIVNSGVHSKEFFNEMWRRISSGNTWCGEVCNRAKDGSFYWVQATIFPVFHAETNEIYRYAAIRFDITEKKEQELALSRRAAQYKAVIETTDGFCRINRNGRFLDVSEGYCHITGYSQDELMQMNIYDMDASENFVERMNNFKYLIESNGKSYEAKRRRKNGSIWTAEINASYSTLDDGSLFVFFHDITERKSMEEHNEMLRQQVNQMQKLDSIGRLTAGIAHDFNNVLASILGYNDFNQDISDEMPESEMKRELRHNVEQVKIAANRAVELINKMLTYTRQKVPRKTKDTKPTAQVIEEVVNMLRSGLTSKFQVELNMDASLNIDVDTIDMHQIMTNLLVNARDAMRQQGSGLIKIQLQITRNLNGHCDACFKQITGDFIELSVSDTGTGIDKETISHIFDPFFTTKSVGEGTGLGLSVVNGIVRDSGGHLLVESQLGKGTTFRLIFPLPSNSQSI
ncbi:MAG: PAS domain S-box protein [Methylococcales bacterium]|nr:PAS domain S-box protein [Methylococcales bacterium]